MNQVESGSQSWDQLTVGIVTVLVIAAVVLAVSVAWRIGLSAKARAWGVDISGGIAVAVMSAIALIISAILVAAGGQNAFIAAVSALVAAAGCGSAWAMVFAVRDRAGAVHDAHMSARIAAANRVQPGGYMTPPPPHMGGGYNPPPPGWGP